MQRPISFTYIIIVTICSLMNIIALMPATKAYEILLRNWGGETQLDCSVWQEDAQHKFITYIPPNLPYPAPHYYGFNCATFDGMDKNGADLRNGILTYHTLDNTTTYWVDFSTTSGYDTNKGGYNTDTCFHVYGGMYQADLYEAPYEECEKIRDSK